MVRIIPGVEIQVVKEIVPQQLHPAGIVGLIGTAEKGPVLSPVPITSYREYTEKFGSSADYSLTRNAKLCFLNGVAEVFATRIVSGEAKVASLILKDDKKLTPTKKRLRETGSLRVYNKTKQYFVDGLKD